MSGFDIFEKLGQLPDDILDEYFIWSVMAKPKARPRGPGLMSRFFNSGWGVAILCAVVSVSVVIGIIQAGQQSLSPPAWESRPVTGPEESETEVSSSEENTEIETETEAITDAPVIYEYAGIQYTVQEDLTCYVSGVSASLTGRVTLPTSLPSGEIVTAVGDKAFYAAAVTSVTLPDTVTSIGEKAFWGCRTLTEIHLGNGVSAIGKAAFDGCTSLTTIMIPEGVRSIREDTFFGCYKLTSIYLPSTLGDIEERAFKDCTRLGTIYFYGTEEQWQKIRRGMIIDFEVENLVVHFMTSVQE